MLILTEKPSVAKAFAEALNVPRKNNFWENNNYCIVNALGHLLENYSPEDYDPALKNWSLDGLPIIPEKVNFKPIEKTKEQLAVVKNCFIRRKNDPFLLATDAEREGELIGAEILDYVGFSNYSNARRFWVSEALTPEVITAGIKNAKPLFEYTSYKNQGFARQQADWLVGMNLTRLITLKTGKLLHFGRVQTALLAAIYQREKSIAHFIPEPYFEVKALLQGERTFSVKLINPDNEEYPARFNKDSKILSNIENIKNSKSGRIIKIDKEKKTVQPPQLFNLTALQKEAHKKYGYSPEKTLNIAQSLYEKHKCLSYPRTPSRVMGDENVTLVKSIYDKLLSAYKKTCREEAMSGTDSSLINADNKRLFNSAELQDHHALIPLSPLPGKLADDKIGFICDCSKEEIDIYTLVFDRFFTLLKPPYIYNSILINIDISGFTFTGNGIEVLQTGWKTYNDTDDDEDESLQNYSGLEDNKYYPVSSIYTEENKTQPKKHYTFTSLLQLMENPRNEEGKRLIGLGTPATRGAILQKLLDRKYINLSKKNVLITDEGKFLIENILKNDELAAFVSIPETTRWEEHLYDNIHAFISGIKDFIRRSVQNTDMESFQFEKKSLGKCPVCKGDIYEGKKNYYCSNHKPEKPCFSIWKEICKAAVTPSDVQTMLSGKKTKFKKCISKAGKEFKAAFYLSDNNVKMEFEDKKILL